MSKVQITAFTGEYYFLSNYCTCPITIDGLTYRSAEAAFQAAKCSDPIDRAAFCTVPPVDVITFGSPCQDLSIAGKRAGMAGERSGLFSEAVRIIREMRYATFGAYPKYAIWENVPGAFSSNKGEDFHAVLQSLCRVIDPAAVIPRPTDARGGEDH